MPADTTDIPVEPIPTGTAYPMRHGHGQRSINLPPGTVPFLLGVTVTLAIMWACREISSPRRRSE